MRVPAFIHLPGDEMPAPAPVLQRPLARLALRFRLWRAEQRILAEIARLDAATLRDIGVSAWQLREHFRGERERVLRREAGWLNLS
jgi:uncharacterized protein YjiS (DUF1127 family)